MAKKNKNKKQANVSNVMVPLGPQSVANVLPRQTRWRTFEQSCFQSRGFNVTCVQSTTSTQTYGPVGTKFFDLTLQYRLSEFFISNYLARYDAYRFDEIQVYAYTITADTTVRIMTSIDQDDNSVISWGDFRKRSNVSTCALRLNNPMQLIAKWKPYPQYDSTQGDAVSNKIGVPGTWFDTKASEQTFGILKIHAEGSSPLADQVEPIVGFLARAVVTFRAPV